MIQLLLNKATPHFQLLPLSKVDQSWFTHSWGAAFTVSEKSNNTYTKMKRPIREYDLFEFYLAKPPPPPPIPLDGDAATLMAITDLL